MNKSIVFRKADPAFHSIENVFNSLIPYLNARKVVLPYQSRGLLKRLKNIFNIKRQNPNLLHISGHDHYLLWFPFKNAILTIHDIESLKRKSGLSRLIFKWLWFDLPIHNASLVTTISEFSAAEINSLGNYSTPIKVIHNPLSLPLQFKPKPFDSFKPKILHIGTKSNKNLFRLIEAVDGLPCKLIILGDGCAEIHTKLKRHKIDYIIRNGLSNAEMQVLYSQIDLLAFVSTYEGFGLPIIEAQAIGRPVLTSNLASMPEVAGEGAHFVDPYSIEDIRKGLNELISDAVLRNKLIEKGRENIKRFDPKKIAAQYQELYDQVANEA